MTNPFIPLLVLAALGSLYTVGLVLFSGSWTLAQPAGANLVGTLTDDNGVAAIASIGPMFSPTLAEAMEVFDKNLRDKNQIIAENN